MREEGQRGRKAKERIEGKDNERGGEIRSRYSTYKRRRSKSGVYAPSKCGKWEARGEEGNNG